MIVPRLRSEARGGSSSGSSTRYSGGVYGGKIHHGNNSNDPDLKRALQCSYTLQAVRRWEKRWVVIHETSMRVHKWMPAPTTAPTLASQAVVDKTADPASNNNDTEKQPEESQLQQKQQESTATETQDTQMLVDEESTSQSSQA
ncbi:unnamed protein product [Rotaria sp. Silwood1]|nr:unnamed protein product [Rotaria sp. Silwood1]CAF3466246.1 unnamed protein product [Rotaria sp. Silwood1]CAF3520695.1 unnamed protein product [Rotaria sp. Silwood1]CAF3524360.1 unnamed protein product [Rotaria sp. Silwood1]CAF4652820.1 unnamed protein product [Rotaria sp. Silwood1]